ncbi:hypothetical protein V8E36_004707 [Tilletia maclaganii]
MRQCDWCGMNNHWINDCHKRQQQSELMENFLAKNKPTANTEANGPSDKVMHHRRPASPSFGALGQRATQDRETSSRCGASHGRS